MTGKTHTMMGDEFRDGGINENDGSAKVSGIIPQSLVDIFSTIQARKHALPPSATNTCHWRVFVSYLEVYNEQIFDLIGPAAGRQPLSVREDAAKGVVVVSGLSEVPVQNANQVLELLRYVQTYF